MGGIVCALPDQRWFGRATGRLIADLGEFCRELGLLTFTVRGVRSFVWAVSRGRVVVVLYPGFLNPIVGRILELPLRLLYVFVYLFAVIVLGRRFILYVYDLPIEQNLAMYGFVRWMGIFRYFERLIFRFASNILVFNVLNVVYLSRLYGLDRKKFSLFELLDYGSTIPGMSGSIRSFGNRASVIYAANFSNVVVRNCFSQFVNSCYGDIKFFAIGNKVELINENVIKLSEVPSGVLPLIYGYFNFGLVLKCSWYYEFTATSKFSSYIHAGLPVLVPESYRYLSLLVKKFNIGFTFKDCKDLIEKYKKLQHGEYVILRKNAVKLGFRLRRGYFFKKALYSALKALG